MDIMSFGGAIGGVLLLLFGLYSTFHGGGITKHWLLLYLHLPSALITFGGALASTMINTPIAKFKELIPAVKNAFIIKEKSPLETIQLLVSFAEKARREGLLTLEDEAEQLEDKFLKKGIQLVVDGTDPELVNSIMNIELNYLEERHNTAIQIVEWIGYCAPAFGMIGTVMGLIGMLPNLGGDPTALGPYLATALITTLYGAIAANLFIIPIANKLRTRSGEEILLKQVMVQGIMSIQQGDNPRIVQEKLKAFLAPKLREAEEVKRKTKGEKEE